MATSFVEQATLRVNDQSSAPIRKVNTELTKLLANAQKLRNISINLGINQTALNNVRKLQTELNKTLATVQRLKGQRVNIPTSIPTVPAAPPRPVAPYVPPSRQPMTLPTFPGGRSSIPIDPTPFTNAMQGFLQRLGFTIQNAILQGFKEGVREADVAETKLLMQGLTEAEQSQVQQSASRLAEESGILNRFQAQNLITESLQSAQGDIAGATAIAEAIAGMTKLQVALGDTTEAALEGAIGYGKAGEQMGQLTDEAGKIDPAKVENFFTTLQRGMIAVGEEFGPDMVRNFVKYARGSKYGLDERALIGGFILSEELGTSAGVGWNQAVKQLTGERITKRNLNNLVDLGLLTTEQAEAGQVGDQTITELVANGAVNEEELRSNLLNWMGNNLIPTMEAQGVDMANTTEVQKFLGKIFSDRTAADIGSALVIRYDEMQAQIDRVMSKDLEKIQSDVLAESSLVTIESLANQWQGLLSQMVDSLEGGVMPVLTAFSNVLRNITQWMEEDTTGIRAGIVALGGVLGAAGFSVGVAALGASGPALIAAAASLEAAALSLGTAGLGGLGNMAKGGLLRTALGRLLGPIGAGTFLYALLNPSETNEGEAEFIDNVNKKFEEDPEAFRRAMWGDAGDAINRQVAMFGQAIPSAIATAIDNSALGQWAGNPKLEERPFTVTPSVDPNVSPSAASPGVQDRPFTITPSSSEAPVPFKLDEITIMVDPESIRMVPQEKPFNPAYYSDTLLMKQGGETLGVEESINLIAERLRSNIPGAVEPEQEVPIMQQALSQSWIEGATTMGMAFDDGNLGLQDTLSTGANDIATAGTTAGQNMSTQLDSAAPGWGAVMADALGARLQAILSNLSFPTPQTGGNSTPNSWATLSPPGLDTGAQGVTE